MSILKGVAGLQRAALTTMPDTATVLRSTPTSSAGGYSQNFLPHHTTQCRLLGTTAPVEAIAAAEIASISRWRMTVPVGSDVLPEDRVSCNGHTFEVAGKIDGNSFNITDTWYLEEIRR